MRHLHFDESDLGQLRRRLINDSYRFLAWVLPVLAIANLSRLLIGSDQPVAYSTLFTALAVVLIYRFRNRFSLDFKLFAVLGLAILVATENFSLFTETTRVLVILTIPVILFSCGAKPRLAYGVAIGLALYPLCLMYIHEVTSSTVISQAPLVALSLISYLLLIYLVSDKLFGLLLVSAENEFTAMRTDQGTGGLNERAIREQIELFLSRVDAPVVRVYMLHLREIISGNNNLEPQHRDKIAVYLNAILTRALPANVVHGRLGDGHIVVVAPRSNWSETESALKNLKSHRVDIGDAKLSLDPVVVTTDGPVDGRSADQLLDNLRRVLERALRDRLELARFLPIDRALRDTAYLFVGDLSQAMELGDLKLYLQPKVTATDEQRIVGAEALIRWNHPSKGLLSPGQFLPQIENSNSRVGFAKYVIQQSAELLNRIRQHAPDFQLSFNLSPYDLNDLRIIAELQRVMELYEFDKGRLQVEISESETTINIDSIRRSIDAIRNLGYSISLDDFGTGMCSLNYFSALSVDSVKIDRAFLESIETSEIAQHVVQSIVELCRGLHREVVVEGVETNEQAALVGKLGCDLMQGYLYGKAVDQDEFLKRLATEKIIERSYS